MLAGHARDVKRITQSARQGGEGAGKNLDTGEAKMRQ